MTPPVIVLAFSNDANAHLELLKKESKEVFGALRELDREEFVKVHREESADVDEIFRALLEYQDRVAIFHYGGHADGTTLRMEGGAAHAQGLSGLLGEQTNLKLVFLNGCATKPQVEQLLAAGVKAVIATTVPIRDDKATEFAARFYQALASRRTIAQAFSIAQVFLKTTYGDVVDVGVVKMRDLGRADEVPGPAGDTIPWGLYVKAEHEAEVLAWKLPTYRTVGLPPDMLQYIERSFKANRFVMSVLDDMTRYNPDIYAQMTEHRGGEIVKRDSREYPELIVRNFPWPLGSQILLLRQYDAADADRLEHLVSAYVRTGQLLYYILLSDLWEQSRRKRLSVPASFVHGLPIDAATFGSFDFLARAVDAYRAFGELKLVPYVSEYERVVATWDDPKGTLQKAHAWLEQLRAELRAGPPQGDIAQKCLLAEQALSIVLRASAFLARYRMLTVRNISVEALRFEAVSYEIDFGPLNGSSAPGLYQDPAHRRKTRLSNSHSVVLARDEKELDDCLNLSPFIIDKNTYVSVKKGEGSDTDRLADIFLLSYQESGRLVYLAVKHSIRFALENDGDRVHTDMTQEDFTEGRNLTQTASAPDPFGLGASFELEPAAPSEGGAKVFSVLREQFESCLADHRAPGMTRSPFKFLDSYQKEDAQSFFGRERETAQLFNAVHASNLVLVYGASGTGKTSIINCGLANQFVASDWLPLYVRRGTELNQSLDRALAGAVGEGREAGSVVDQVRELYLEHYRPLYLIFDQFEELFILGARAEQQRFYETLRQLLTIGATCKVLIVIREEYIAYLSELEKVVPSLFDNRLRVEKLNDSHLARIIVGTTRAAGIRLVDPVVTVTRILESIRDRRTGVDLANLQVYLDRLWRADVARQGTASPAQVTFDPPLVDQVGKLANVISAFLDEQLAVIEAALGERGVAKPQGIPLEVLFALVTEEGTKRPLDVAGVLDALPGNRNVDEAHVRFCLSEFERLRLVRPLGAG